MLLLERSGHEQTDSVCFHCQQSAEKNLKALLVEAGLPVPRTHQLDDLLGLLRTCHPELLKLRRGLIYLTNFAVVYRYPGSHASARQARSAARWEAKVRLVVRKLLGL